MTVSTPPAPVESAGKGRGRMALGAFSGAKASRLRSVGSSILVESRSAWRPAFSSSSALASGIVFRWM